MMAVAAVQTYAFILGTLAVLQVDCYGIEMDLLRVESDVEHRYAVTHVTAAVTNRRNTSQEIPLKMILPKNAYVTSLVMDVGGRNFTTIVTEKRRNRRKGPIPNKTETSKNRKRNENAQKFRASAKARGLQKVIFYLSYEELLHRTKGRYTHTLYLGAAKRVGVVEVTVRVVEKEALKDFRIAHLPWSSSSSSSSSSSASSLLATSSTDADDLQVRQEVNGPGNVIISFKRENVTINMKNTTTATDDEDENANNDVAAEENEGVFSITYDIDRQADGGEIQVLGQFFVHYFSPEGLPKLPTHTVFVLDVSGSMHDNGKLQQLKMAMKAILTDLQPEDSFEVLVFSTRVTSLGVFRAEPNDIQRGLSKIQRLQALGGTNFNDALLKALQEINSFNLTSGAKQVVFLTDGRPNLGEKKPNQLRRNIREANIHHHPIFSLGFGQDADMRLLRQVSADNRGFTRKIDEEVRPAEQLKGFYDEISAPLMTDVDVMYLEDEVDPNSVVRYGPSTFYAGDEMVLAGQLMEGVTQVQPIITGQGSAGPLQFRVSRISTTDPPPERDNYVERLWAYLTVQDLLDTQEVVEDNNLRAEMNARALEIALRFHFVTELTSLDLEEPSDAQSGEGHPYKSASRHQKSNTGGLKLLPEELTLLSEAEFAKTLPAPLSTRLNMASHNRFSFGDNDPHFVVQVSGIEMPLCFDIHGQHGQVLSLVRDSSSGIVVTGRVTSAVGRPEATYFTELFIGLGKVNFTITPHNITISTLEGHRDSEGARVLRSVWPFKKMYRSGGRGDKTRLHSNRKFHRQKRSHVSDLYSSYNKDTRHKLAISGRSNHIKIPQKALSQSLNSPQRRFPEKSIISGQHQQKIISKHITHGLHNRFQNNFLNLGHREPWAQNYQNTLTENNLRSHKSNSILKDEPKYWYQVPNSFPNPKTKTVPYHENSQILYKKDIDPRVSAPSVIRNKNNFSYNINSRNPEDITKKKHEHKKRQRRWSKFRKRGRMRYKRNNLLTTTRDPLQQQETFRSQNTNRDIFSGHIDNRQVHPHAPVNHKRHKGNSHPHPIRHHSHMHRHKDHTNSNSNPLLTSINNDLMIHSKGTHSHSYDNYHTSSDSTDGYDDHPKNKQFQPQTIINKNLFGTSVRNYGNSDKNEDHVILPSSNAFTHHLSTGQLLQHNAQKHEDVSVGENNVSPVVTEHLIHTHSKTDSKLNVRQDNKNIPTLGSEPSSRSQIHPQAHIPSLLHGNQSYFHVNRNYARPLTPSSCNQTIPQQGNSKTIAQHIACMSKLTSSRASQLTVKNQYPSESLVRPHQSSGTQSIATQLEDTEDKPFFDLSTEIQDSRESNVDDDEDLSEEEQSVSTDLSVSTTAESPPYIYHPHSRVFSHTQAEHARVITDPEREKASHLMNNDSQEGLHYRNHQQFFKHVQEHPQELSTRQEEGHEQTKTNEACHKDKSTKTYTWRRAAGRRYGDVIVALRNRKKLDLLIGDVDAHFVITRSKTKYGQEFLGFYVEEHKILSPNTTGIIGQFAYKTVGTMASTTTTGEGENNVGMKLAVLQPQSNMQYRVSEVNGFVSKRRSMLHKSHVRCLLIPNQGRGLVAGNPEDYLLPCLCC